MTKDFSIKVGSEEAEILWEALQERIVSFDKVATQLMKKKLVDAAGPVYTEIKRLQAMQRGLRKEVVLPIEKQN